MGKEQRNTFLDTQNHAFKSKQNNQTIHTQM